MESGSGADVKPDGTRLAGCAAAWTAEQRVQVGPWRMRYREAGEGPVVVLLHGLGLSADYWWRNGPWLAASGYRVLAPDLPGFGRTEGPPDGLSVGEQTRSLRRWAEAMELGRAVYVGHSLSCQTVLRLGAEDPERVAGLVLAAPSGDPRRFRLVREAIGLLRDAPRESWRMKMIVAQAYLRAGPVRTWKTWLEAAADDALETAERVRVPGVVVMGRRDPVVRPAFAEALAERLGGAGVAWIEGGAHAVIHDTAEAFNEVVLGFLGGVKWEE
jgi:2-hydroxy-6-oxonona-2,4-dienedioate hydrolase